jgi:hypothetical protein
MDMMPLDTGLIPLVKILRSYICVVFLVAPQLRENDQHLVAERHDPFPPCGVVYSKISLLHKFDTAGKLPGTAWLELDRIERST